MMDALAEFAFLRSVGGKPITKALALATNPAEAVAWNFGLLADWGPQAHTARTVIAHDRMRIARPRIHVTGHLSDDPKKVILSDVFKHPTVQEALKPFLQKAGGRSTVYPGIKQISGSCVGTGFGNLAAIAAAIEVAWKSEPESPVVFFWPFTYARGRFRGGMRSAGDGSFSEAQAEAALVDGMIRADLDGLPLLADKGDGLVMDSARHEIQWSDGDAANILPLLEKGRVNRFKQSAVIRSVDDARACIRDAKMPFMFCFPAGTPVRMANGNEKDIDAVKVGDKVVSHTGQHRQVLQTFNRDYSGEMFKVHVSGFPFPLEMTADHPVAVVHSNADWRWTPGSLRWVKASDLREGDRVLIGGDRTESPPETLDLTEQLGGNLVVLDGGRVRTTGSHDKSGVHRYVYVTPSLGRLLGLYMAEGGVTKSSVRFTYGAHEPHLVSETLALMSGLFGIEGKHADRPPNKGTALVVFNSEPLHRVIKGWVPGNVYTKRIPGFLLRADKDTKLAFLLGWMHGDGYAKFRNDENRQQLVISGKTVSAVLARDLTVMAISCGIKTSCCKMKARGRSKESYKLTFTGKTVTAMFPALAEQAKSSNYRVTDTDTRRCRFGYAQTIKKIDSRRVESMPVYDIEVEEDHSFLANDIVVHNCGMWGGLMQCPVVGNPPVLLNRSASQWAHNQTCIAWYDHPELGELFGIWNQWGFSVHGSDPAGLPPGAYWIKKDDMNRQARGGSCIAVTAFDGFPALDLKFDWTA